jgi:riboflavin synthase
VNAVRRSAAGFRLEVSFGAEFDRWVVAKGSIALDGVSLTVAHRVRGSVTVALIPETLATTTLGSVRAGDPVNVEFDQIIKAAAQSARPRGVDEALLERAGY